MNRRTSTDWKTIIAVGLMIGGLWAGLNRELGEIKGEQKAMRNDVQRVETNSVTKAGVADVVRSELQKVREDVDNWNAMTRRTPPTPGFNEWPSLRRQK